MKTCPDCGETKPLTEFYRRRGNAVQAYCKRCHLVRVNVTNARKRAERQAAVDRAWVKVAAHAERFGIRTEGYSDDERASIVGLYEQWVGAPI
jgi:uncharacterized Zn finger protein